MPDGDAGDQSFFVWWHGGDPAASLEMHSVRPEIIEAIRALHRMASIGTAGFRCRPPSSTESEAASRRLKESAI